MKDANTLKRELDQQVERLSEEQLRDVLDLARSLSRKKRSSRSSLGEEIEAITQAVPDETWEQLPADGAEQHDHYIYGTPKRDP